MRPDVQYRGAIAMLSIDYLCVTDLVSNKDTDEQSCIPPQIEADRTVLVKSGCRVFGLRPPGHRARPATAFCNP